MQGLHCQTENTPKRNLILTLSLCHQCLAMPPDHKRRRQELRVECGDGLANQEVAALSRQRESVGGVNVTTAMRFGSRLTPDETATVNFFRGAMARLQSFLQHVASPNLDTCTGGYDKEAAAARKEIISKIEELEEHFESFMKSPRASSPVEGWQRFRETVQEHESDPATWVPSYLEWCAGLDGDEVVQEGKEEEGEGEEEDGEGEGEGEDGGDNAEGIAHTRLDPAVVALAPLLAAAIPAAEMAVRLSKANVPNQAASLAVLRWLWARRREFALLMLERAASTPKQSPLQSPAYVEDVTKKIFVAQAAMWRITNSALRPIAPP